MTIILRMKTTVDELKKAWCVYVVYDGKTAKIKQAGYGMLRDIFHMRIDFDPDEPFILSVNELYDNKKEALHGYYKFLNGHGVPNGGLMSRKARNVAIECIETGETWGNAKECVKACGMSQSALSNHLNGKAGYKHVKNLTYKRMTG